MTVLVVAFFNNKGGVGKTSMLHHVAWMLADRGRRVVAVDLDPQSNLSAYMLSEERFESLFCDDGISHEATIYGALDRLRRGVGDITDPHVEAVDERLGLVVGDLALSGFEDDVAGVWSECVDRKERAFLVTSAFWRLMQRAAVTFDAELVLVDLGPNLGAINRAALIGCDHVVIPLGPDLFSLQGLENVGPTLRDWRDQWADRKERNPASDLPLPGGRMNPIGYVVLRHAIRLDRPVRAFDRWIERIPETYARAVLDVEPDPDVTIETDPNCIARLKDYRSLMPLAHEARKPIFHLRPADGALGAHATAAARAYGDFRSVTAEIVARIGLPPLE